MAIVPLLFGVTGPPSTESVVIAPAPSVAQVPPETATVVAAECLGWEEDLGTVQTGKLADIIIVDGDPLADIAVLRDPGKIALVVKDGAVAANRIAR